MSLTREQYEQIMEEYAARRLAHARELDRRREEVYARIDGFRRLDETPSVQGVETLRTMIGKTPGDREYEAARDNYRIKMQAVADEKRRLLREAGYSEDYLSPIVSCRECGDTGYVGDRKCRCFLAREIELLYDQSRLKERMKTERFNTLDLSYYQGEDRTRFMKAAEAVKEFSQHFGDPYLAGIVLTGNTGVGKSFLATCAACELLKQRRSVLYFPAYELFEKLRTLSFDSSKREELQRLKEDLAGVELLIIDDLGTENLSQFTVSSFFAIINDRLLGRKSTLLTSNLSPAELEGRYTERISSRLALHYQLFRLTGEDIRVQKVRRHSRRAD